MDLVLSTTLDIHLGTSSKPRHPAIDVDRHSILITGIDLQILRRFYDYGWHYFYGTYYYYGTYRSLCGPTLRRVLTATCGWLATCLPLCGDPP